jgi:hypothetical protein
MTGIVIGLLQICDNRIEFKIEGDVYETRLETGEREAISQPGYGLDIAWIGGIWLDLMP